MFIEKITIAFTSNEKISFQCNRSTIKQFKQYDSNRVLGEKVYLKHLEFLSDTAL